MRHGINGIYWYFGTYMDRQPSVQSIINPSGRGGAGPGGHGGGTAMWLQYRDDHEPAINIMVL